MADGKSGMHGDLPENGPENLPVGDMELQSAESPEPVSRTFYLALVLIIVLVLMVVLINYPAAKANAGLALTKSDWALQSLVDNTGILIPALGGSEVTARFESSGNVSGHSGCNQYFATYQTQDYQITINGTGSTLMYCPNSGVMEQESAFLSDLSRSSSFRVSDSTLTIYDAAGKTLLVFVPA